MKNKETLDEIIRQGNTMYLHNPYVDLEPLVPYATYTNDLTRKQLNQVVVPVRTEPKYQNNEPCPCGSGNKYKKCCKTK